MIQNVVQLGGENPIRLQLKSTKFTEVKLHKESLTVHFSEGDLSDGKVVSSSVEETDLEGDSLEDAHKTINNLVTAKLDAGFRIVENWEKHPGFADYTANATTGPNAYNEEEWYGYEEEKGVADVQNIDEVPDHDENSHKPKVKKSSIFKTLKEKFSSKPPSKPSSKAPAPTLKSNLSEVVVEKELSLCSLTRPVTGEIESKANELKLKYKNLDHSVLVAGSEHNILEFVSWMYNLTIRAIEDDVQRQRNAREAEISSGDYQLKKIFTSTFHRTYKEKIQHKAKELKVICNFGYDFIVASANKKSFDEFKSYLYELEILAKKLLYPKYWEFDGKNAFTDVILRESATEYKMVASLFYKSLKNATITKLKRIQNKFLMDHYVTMLQKRQEARENTAKTRKFLFHGTRTIEPEKIYKSMDTGFDLQYSNPNGLYGKGLYFAVEASYSHNGFTYNAGGGKYQMFLADVFIGNSFQSLANRSLVKPPEGYDSIDGYKNGFYILYNNFHSYPLYLIEYTMNDKNQQTEEWINQTCSNEVETMTLNDNETKLLN